MRYDKYKPTDIPWLPEMPVGWETRRLRSLFSMRDERYDPKEKLIVLSLLKDVGVIPYEDKGDIGNKSKDDITQYKVARKGDVVMNSMNVIIGSVDISPYDGYISPAYYALKGNDGVAVKYYNYIFHLTTVQKTMRSLANGILEIRLRITPTKLFGMKYPLPPRSEQERIVAYLDEKCGKIDEAVKAKKREVELLEEMRESVIAEAVTRGVDHKSLKVPTGVFWQPRMPIGWSVKKCRHVLQKLSRPRPQDAELLVCTNKGTVNKRGDAKIGLVSDDETIYQGVAAGDLLIHGMDTWHGAIAVSEFDGMCTPVVHVCDSAENKAFVAYCFQNMARGKLFKLISNGVRQNTSDFRSWEKVARLPLVLPSRDEQDCIVAYIEARTAKIDEAVKAKKREVELLEELKQSLIAETVTGQRKVA